MLFFKKLTVVAMAVALAACGEGAPSTGAAGSATPIQALASTTAAPSTADISKQIDLTDAIGILKLIVGLNVNADGSGASPEQLLAADFDQSGTIDLSDAIGVLKLIVGLTTATPTVKMYNVDTLATNYVANATTSTSLTPSAWVGGSAASGAGSRVLSIVTGDVNNSWSSDATTYTSTAKKSDLTAALTAAKNGTIAVSDVAGTVGTGAPFVTGTVTVYGSDGAVVKTANIGTDGSYKLALPTTASYPLTFVADDGAEKLVSVKADASSSNVNVTQITHLIAAKLSAKGDPLQLASEVAVGTSTVTQTAVDTNVQGINTALAPLYAAHGLTASDYNPITKVFVANGAGYDRLLDTLDVKILPNGTTASTLITVKQAVPETGSETDQALPAIVAQHNAALPTVSTISAANLPPSGLTPALQTLLDSMTTCYALPIADRVGYTSGTTLSITAADLKSKGSATCKGIFHNGDPTLYKQNGAVVKKYTGGAYGSMYSNASAIKFTSPRYLYSVSADVTNGPSSGDVVFAYRYQDDYGNFQYDKQVARKGSDGKYRLIGNQYQYSGGVTSYSQRRNFVNQSASTFYSVGYSLNTNCTSLVAAGVTKVRVTAFNGKTMVLLPNTTSSTNATTLQTTTTCNYSYFTLATGSTYDSTGDKNTPSGTGFIRIRSEWETGDTTTTNHPRNYNSNLGFIGTDMEEASIKGLPNFGIWKFDYFTTDIVTPVATQYYKTSRRAQTIAELKQEKLPKLTDAYTATLQAAALCSSINTTYFCIYPAAGKVSVNWLGGYDGVAIAGNTPSAYRVRLYGKYGSNWAGGYEDGKDVRSSDRTVAIGCGEGDSGSVPSAQCESTPTTQPWNFATTRYGTAKTTIDSVDLISRSPDLHEFSHFNSIHKLNAH